MNEDNTLNIVIFGANGMLAQDLIELLNYEENIFVRSYTRRECSIDSYDDVWSCIGGTKGSISHVINCAAFTNVDKAEDHEELAFKTNNEGPRILADICKENQIHLTHISTNYVFEGLKKEPYLEQDETCPLSIYGKSKLAGEGHVRALGDKGLVVRTSWLFGKHGKNFIDTVLNKLDLGVKAKVITDEIATPTYTMDLANAIIQLVISYKSGLFHITNSGSCSWFEFAKEAARLTDLNLSYLVPVKSKELNRKADRPKYSVLSMNRLERTLSEPIRSWKKALYQYLLETKRIYE